MNDLKQHIEIAKQVMLEAGKMLREDTQYKISYKKDASPVTSLDKKIELFIQQKLLNAFPLAGFIGEEYESINADNDWLWICDPIDGTRSFIAGKNTVAISLALYYKGEPKIGIINNPVKDELFVGSEYGVFLNEEPLTNLDKTNLDEININYQAKNSPTLKSQLKQLARQKAINSVYYQGGSVAYNFMSILKGEADAYILSRGKEFINLWDIAGGVALIKYFGGYITDFERNELSFEVDNQTIIVVRNKELHHKLFSVLEHKKDE